MVPSDLTEVPVSDRRRIGIYDRCAATTSVRYLGLVLPYFWLIHHRSHSVVLPFVAQRDMQLDVDRHAIIIHCLSDFTVSGSTLHNVAQYLWHMLFSQQTYTISVN
jgi:hypothetical protein